jgi:cytochrome c
MSAEDLEPIFIETVDSGNVAEARRLLGQHPDLLHTDFGGYTPLHAASADGHLDLVKLFIELGSDVNAEEDFGNRGTPLEYALKNDNPELVRLLLEHGANPNHGRTVFRAMTGDKKNSLEIVKLLEQHGADLHQVFVNELTEKKEPMNALSLAIACGKEDVAQYLKSRGAVLP